MRIDTVVYIRKVKKSESKSQRRRTHLLVGKRLCISVKLKNLKANHNCRTLTGFWNMVVYIRKVKKSESKSQPEIALSLLHCRLCISVKLKNLKANHNQSEAGDDITPGCVYP